ncbi:baseplate J/gp47 family protein [Streptomyces vinaceus]|uniref:hypothetical protein n=1 Tax=Streptomyces vinaceus TaxID=1960 RepID=UPI003681186A
MDTLRFQDLVDEAKRILPEVYPGWTDHNVSDPGITLIESCATAVDQMSYRLGRTPQAVQAACLKLLAPPPRSAVPARTLLTFTRNPNASAESTLTIPAGTRVATDGTETDTPLIFTTQETIDLPRTTAYAYGKPTGDKTDLPAPGNSPAYTVSLQANAEYTNIRAGEKAFTDAAVVLFTDPGPCKTVTVQISLAPDPRTGAAPAPATLQWDIAASDAEKKQTIWTPAECLGVTSPDDPYGRAEVTLKVPSQRLVCTADTTVDTDRGKRKFHQENCIVLRLSAPAWPGSRAWEIASLFPLYAVAPPVPALQIRPWGEILTPGNAAHGPFAPGTGADQKTRYFPVSEEWPDDPRLELDRDWFVEPFSDHTPSNGGVYHFEVQARAVPNVSAAPLTCWGTSEAQVSVPCPVLEDTTAGLTQNGRITVSVPPAVETPLRLSLDTDVKRRIHIQRIEGIYGVHANPVPHARMVSDGTPGQRLKLPDFPVMDARHPLKVTVTPSNGLRQTWTRVDSFATASDQDPYYTLDAATSEIVFGPCASTADGSRQYGRVPASGAIVEVMAAATDGSRGNVSANSLTHLIDTVYSTPDDVLTTSDAIHFLYGNHVATIPHDGGNPTFQDRTAVWPALTRLGNAPITAALSTPGGDLFFFAATQFVHATAQTAADSATAPVALKDLLTSFTDSNRDKGFLKAGKDFLSRPIDAALCDNTHLRLFSDETCMSLPLNPVENRPALGSIGSLYSDLPDDFTGHLDAATTDATSRDVHYLFRGSGYVRCNQMSYDGTYGTTLEMWPALRRALPLPVTVTNPAPAVGGTGPETLADILRNTRYGLIEAHRAVTATDYMHALNGRVPGLARVICLPPPATSSNGSALSDRDRYDLQVLLLPELPPGHPPSLRALTPSPGLYDATRDRLQALRLLGTRVLLSAPTYHRLHINASVFTDLGPAHYPRLREQIRAALQSAFHPLTGPPNGDGWPLDRPPTSGEALAAIASVADVNKVLTADVKDLDALTGSSQGFLPLIDVLDVTINNKTDRRYQDSLLLRPADDPLLPPAERSMRLQFTADPGRTWSLVPGSQLSNGAWASPPTTQVTSAQPGALSCTVIDRSKPLTGSVTYQLATTSERVVVSWDIPPTGPNQYAVTTTGETTAMVTPVPGTASQAAKTNERTPFSSTQLSTGDDAHPHLAVALKSTAKRTLAITLSDVGGDTWVLQTPSAPLNCAYQGPAPSKGIEKAFEKCSFVVQSTEQTNFSDPMKGTVTFKLDGDPQKLLTLEWSATADGTVTYTASNRPENVVLRLQDKTEITGAGTVCHSGFPGGGLNAIAEITLLNTKHRSFSIHMVNTFPEFWLKRADPVPVPVNGQWTEPPPAEIHNRSEESFTCAAVAQDKDLHGEVTYTFKSPTNAGTTMSVTVSCTSPDPSLNRPPSYTLKLPEGVTVQYDKAYWTKGN